MQAWRQQGTAGGRSGEQMFADYQVLKKFLSARPISTNENRNRNRNIGIAKLFRVERRGTRETASISKLLSPSPSMSTVGQIQKFIAGHNKEDTKNACAQKIQRAWRRHQGRKRLLKILAFMVQQGRKAKRVHYFIWQLSRQPTADIARKMYTTVITHYFSTGAIVQSGNRVWISKDGKSTICTFDQFMKTGFLTIDRSHDPAIITRFVKLMNREMLRRIIAGWSTYAIDKAVAQRQSRRVQVLLKMRQIFGPEFWCFHFWRNWSSFKKHGQFDMSLERHQYVPEWQMYRARQQHKQRLVATAENQYRTKVAIRAIDSLHNSSIYELRLGKAYRRCLRIFSRTAGEKCIRALRYAAILKKFNDRVRKRLLRAWYEAIDRQAMMRVTGECLRERVILSDMTKVISKWREHVFQRQVLNAYLHNHIRQHQLQSFKTFFLMTGDNVHYGVCTCLSLWRKVIEMKDRMRRFVNWSVTRSRDQAIYKFIFFLLRDVCDKHVNRADALPFRMEKEKLVHSPKKKHAVRNKKWWARLREEIRENKITISLPKTTTSLVLNAYGRLDDIEPYSNNWAKTLSRDEVRTLFFRLVVLMANKSHMPVRRHKVQPPKHDLVRQFQESHELYTPEKVSLLRADQEEESRQARRLLVFRTQRDREIMSALEAHEAALVMKSRFSTFTVASSARNVNRAEPEAKPTRQSIVVPKTKYNPIQSRHPLLQDPNAIKKQILDSNRKFRRNPENIFEKQVVVRAALSMDIPEKRKGQSSLQPVRDYDSHQSITKSKELMNLVSSRQFILTDLKAIQEKANQEIIRLEREADAETLSKAPRTRKRQTIAVVGSRSPRSGRKIQPIDFILPENRPPEVTKVEEPKTVSLDKIATSFVNNPYYLRKERPERVKLLFTRFFAMLNFFLNGADVGFKPPDLEKLHSRIFYIIRKITCPVKRRKKNLPTLPPYEQPKGIPELPAIVIGQIATDSDELSIGFRVFGIETLRSVIDLYLTPAKQMACVREVLCESEENCVNETNRNTIKEIVDMIAEQAIKEEAEMEEQKQKEEQRRLSARKHRKTVSPKSLPSQEELSKPVEEEPRKRKIAPATERKFDFAQDALAMIFDGTTFVTNSVKLFYADDAEVDPFAGIDELRDKLKKRSKEKPKIVEFDDDTKKSPKKKKKVVVKKASPKKKVSPKKKKVVNIFVTEQEPPPLAPLKRRQSRVSWAADVLGHPGTMLCDQNRAIEDSDIDFFMFFAPYIIPCALLMAMMDVVDQKVNCL